MDYSVCKGTFNIQQGEVFSEFREFSLTALDRFCSSTSTAASSSDPAAASEKKKPKTGILMLNMGGPRHGD